MRIARLLLPMFWATAAVTASCRTVARTSPITAPSPSPASLAPVVASHVARELDRFEHFHGSTTAAGAFQFYAETDTTAWGRSVLKALNSLRSGLTLAAVAAEEGRISRRDGVASRGVRVGSYGMIGDTAVVDIWRAQCDPTGGRITLYFERWRWRFVPVTSPSTGWDLVDAQREGGADGWCTPRTP
jgi:hypothetical protein